MFVLFHPRFRVLLLPVPLLLQILIVQVRQTCEAFQLLLLLVRRRLILAGRIASIAVLRKKIFSKIRLRNKADCL